ncbi:glutathione-disulfide reductase [Noviherbaspirillum sp. CPCC 100848]|uniref:Glutathione-disulfide reductase n=1 Tax=Noviherbaspirillum album TaxID=3080276 RepID=A0ABU6JF39_9BURK|nr:glutathione-disulfide reductase [Noviherbaspirillum sp. CPCC 100848]MEC4722274.1 glutathione-disulfide reductase [Noviherbaspirillum sp. CPCC 100848]
MSEHFDLITIGGGSGGVAASRRAAAHGARVALIESDALGGTCVHRGCVPKKLMMYAGQFRSAFDTAAAFGWTMENEQFHMETWQDAKNAELERLDKIYQQMLQSANVELINGLAQITGRGRVRVGARELSCTHLLIATGGRPSAAPIAGLEHAATSEDMLNSRTVPRRMAVVGAGYIGMEFASIFSRLGSEVSVFFRDHSPLRGFDHDLRIRLSQALERAGLTLYAGSNMESLTRSGNGYLLQVRGKEPMAFDAVLNATGRIPNTENLGLQSIGLELGPGAAIPVNDYSATVVPGVYAVGDVTNRKNLTPLAIAEGRAFADTVFGGLDIPFQATEVATAVFTEPSIGTVGLTENDAAQQGALIIYEADFRPMATAFAQRSDRTYMKLVVDAASDRVLGIHMIGNDAPEIIQSLAVSLRAGVTKRQFDQTIAIHPTTAEEFVLMREPARRVPAGKTTFPP